MTHAIDFQLGGYVDLDGNEIDEGTLPVEYSVYPAEPDVGIPHRYPVIDPDGCARYSYLDSNTDEVVERHLTIEQTIALMTKLDDAITAACMEDYDNAE